MTKSQMADRAGLAAAIGNRNAAAKAVEAARTKYEECTGRAIHHHYGKGRIGERQENLKRERWQAQERLTELEAQVKQILEVNGGDRVSLHRVMLGEHGADADTVIEAARVALDKAQKAEAVLAHAAGPLELNLTDCERRLAETTAKVDGEVKALLEKQAPALADELAADMRSLLGKLGALEYMLRSSERQACGADHPLRAAHDVAGWLSSIGSQTAFREARAMLEGLHREGMLPWIAAANRLAVDANAPLPSGTPDKLAAAA